MKLLIIGGYGAFGGRLAQLLNAQTDLTIYIGGRTQAKAEKFCQSLQDAETVFIPIRIDKANIAGALPRYKPDIVVDASGPFSLKRDNPYAVIKACLAANVHYLDLADGADFVIGVEQFDAAARAKKLTVISGLSTCPALTGAILQEAQKGMLVESVEVGVAPSPFARMGLSVVEGVFDYAGGDIKRYRRGKAVTSKALTEARRQTIAPPGVLPLQNRLFGLVDAPDLQVFPAHNPKIKDSWVGAGTRPEYLLRCMIGLAKFRALFRLRRFSALAKPGHRMLNGFCRGEHRGGLYMKLAGPQGEKSWHIMAEGDDGPFVPSMAAAALIRKWMAGNAPKPGARAADQELQLSDFEPFFKTRNIHWGFRDATTETDPVFAQVLGSAFKGLPPLIRELHAPEGTQIWHGKAQTKGPSNIFGRMAGWMAGITVRSTDTPVTVTITRDGNTELWQRDFGDQRFKSRLTPGKGRNEYLMMESFGAISVAMALVVREDRLQFIPRRWFFLGIAMPNFLLPGGDTYEYAEDGKFWFNVNLNLPLFGRIASYKGWLKAGMTDINSSISG